CSGVRSVTALTAIAAFVAWWRGFGFVRGVILVVLSVPVIAGVNAIRVIISGLLQEHVGQEYVRDQWHEALGVAMVLLGLALIVGLAGLLARRNLTPQPPSPAGKGEQSAEPSSPSSLPGKGAGGLSSSVLLALAAVATIAAQFLGRGAEEELL